MTTTSFALWVMVNDVLLLEAPLNVLDNAIEYAGAGSELSKETASRFQGSVSLKDAEPHGLEVALRFPLAARAG